MRVCGGVDFALTLLGVRSHLIPRIKKGLVFDTQVLYNRFYRIKIRCKNERH